MRRCYSSKARPRDYRSAVETLNDLQTNYSVIKELEGKRAELNKLAIPRMIQWARRMGYEPSDFDRLNPIHIAGTKGKGSTSTFISSILSQYLPTKRSIHAERLPSSVGLYTSPHLRYVRERIQIDNQPISEQLFAKYFWEVWDRLQATHLVPDLPRPTSPIVGGKPVYFHFLTLVALHCFMQEQVGTPVIECGIGGEYDTTNILIKPSVTGVTSLGIDHENLLGDTIESIAWHKAGIFKEGVPAFSVSQPEAAANVLLERAKERRTELHFVPIHPALEKRSISLGLQGGFQKTNASLAIAVSAQHLRNLGYTGVPDPLNPSETLPDEFITGLESARLGGRCETRLDKQLSHLTWYIDGAHTIASIEVAADWFAAHVKDPLEQNITRILILNQQTRDAVSLARRLHDSLSSATGDSHPFRHAIFCANKTYRDRGYSADLVSINTDKRAINDLRVQTELAVAWDTIDPDAHVDVFGTIEEAVSRVGEIAGNAEKVEVLATGSLHLVGGLIDVLENEAERAGIE